MQTTFTASVNCVGILDSQLMRRFNQTPGRGFYSSQVPSFSPSFYSALRTKQESIGKSGPVCLTLGDAGEFESPCPECRSWG